MNEINVSNINSNDEVTIITLIGSGNTISGLDLNIVVEPLYLVRFEKTNTISLVKESAVQLELFDRYKPGVCFSEASIGNPYIPGKYPEIYDLWLDMINRCYNPNDRLCGYYGGLAIDTCDRWRCFEYFMADIFDIPGGDMILKNPEEKYAIDIIGKWYCNAYNTKTSAIVPIKESKMYKYLMDRLGANKLPNYKTVNSSIRSQINNYKKSKAIYRQRILRSGRNINMVKVIKPTLHIEPVPVIASTFINTSSYTPSSTPIEYKDEVYMPVIENTETAIKGMQQLTAKAEHFRGYRMDNSDMDHRLVSSGNKIMCTIVK